MTLAADQASLGVMILTNIRFVWFSHFNEQYNVSVPYLQVVSTCVQHNTKFGTAFSIFTGPTTGNLNFGFRLDPEERFRSVYKLLTRLIHMMHASPITGVEISTVSHQASANDDLDASVLCEDAEVTVTDAGAAYAAYRQDASQPRSKSPVFNEELGLAIEPLPDGVTLAALRMI
eukprot:m.6320 g.6320  ORF g.6320 m.6320 type:complete len:175 (+) comp3346_c0_seq1:3-527(+)